MADQPWYHRVDGAILFTAKNPISEDDFIAAVESGLKKLGVVPGTVELEYINDGDGRLVSGYCEPEPGDPSDL